MKSTEKILPKQKLMKRVQPMIVKMIKGNLTNAHENSSQTHSFRSLLITDWTKLPLIT